MSGEIEEDILRSLRRMTRAIDLHSRKLSTTFGLTGPQLVALRALGRLGMVTPSALAKEVSLSQGTVTGIVDRLVARQLVTRERNADDRRLVTVALTSAGRELVGQAPSPLQERFLHELRELDGSARERICATLAQVVKMMGGEEIEAAPILAAGSVACSTAEAREVIEAGIAEVSLTEDVARTLAPCDPTPDKRAPGR